MFVRVCIIFFVHRFHSISTYCSTVVFPNRTIKCFIFNIQNIVCVFIHMLAESLFAPQVNAKHSPFVFYLNLLIVSVTNYCFIHSKCLRSQVFAMQNVNGLPKLDRIFQFERSNSSWQHKLFILSTFMLKITVSF